MELTPARTISRTPLKAKDKRLQHAFRRNFNALERKHKLLIGGLLRAREEVPASENTSTHGTVFSTGTFQRKRRGSSMHSGETSTHGTDSSPGIFQRK